MFTILRKNFAPSDIILLLLVPAWDENLRY